MANYREQVIQTKPMLYKKAVIEEPAPRTLDPKKGTARQRIEQEVFDLADAVADNAKAISLLTSIIVRLYNALPNNTKSKISDEDRAVIEYAFSKFEQIETLGDVVFELEGTSAIDKLFNRQQKIADIVKESYGIK